MSRVLWEPGVDAWPRSRLSEFAEAIHARGGPQFSNYRDMWAWSISQPASFWSTLAGWADIPWHSPATSVLSSTEMPGTEWFAGATLNYAELALRQAESTPDVAAIIGISQTRDRVEISWSELAQQVESCRDGLARLGVGRGDRVAALLPNIPETTVAFLATVGLGAIWSSCAPEFGVRAVVDRWQQIEPKVLFTVDGYRYGDKIVDKTDHVAEILDGLSSVEHVVRVPYLDPDGPDDWTPLVASSGATSAPVVAVPFDHPLWILYSSGTTGLPKPIMHGHGGIVLEHVKTLGLHYDLVAGQRFSWFTTTGWMMWNLVTSSALVGATTVLFDGDPASNDMVPLWKMASDERVDVLGVSASFLMACKAADVKPGNDFDLHALRHLGSTGGPLPAAGFEWVAEAVGAHVQIGSLSGGTDVCTGFVGPVPTLPVRAGEISSSMLGCDVRAFHPDGTECAVGDTGELVITMPLPSMPVGFWGDDGTRYRDTYFSTYPGVWLHGDWITFTESGSCVITGRSDATLNRGGVRLGTSDFYTVVESMSEVSDSVVVHIEDDDGGPGQLFLFVALSNDRGLDDELLARIHRRLRSELSPRHVPDVTIQVRAIPRTLSGKKLEIPIKRLLLGAPVDSVLSRDSLADPSALDAMTSAIDAHRAHDADRRVNSSSDELPPRDTRTGESTR